VLALRAATVLSLIVACAPSQKAREHTRLATPQPAPVKADEAEPPAEASECLELISIDHADSVLSEQRRVGEHVADFHDRYPAEYIDPDSFVPVEAVEGYRIGGTPLLWFNADKTAVVVNAAVLSELVVADATRMRAGDRAVVGQLTELGRGKIAGIELVKFLIRARAIATYVHMGSELCLTAESETAAGYAAHFTGEHTFFTDQKHTESFAFDVSIANDGVITVIATEKL